MTAGLRAAARQWTTYCVVRRKILTSQSVQGSVESRTPGSVTLNEWTRVSCTKDQGANFSRLAPVPQ